MSATTVLTELAAKLTAVAPVRTGRAALETTSAALPVITLWSTDDRISDDQAHRAPAYTRTVQVEIKATAGDTYQTTLDTLLSAARTALRPGIGEPALRHALAVREVRSQFYAPADNGECAVILITLEIDYLDL